MTYSFVYDGTSRPAWQKTLSASSGENFVINLVFENEEDRLNLSLEQAYEYINLLVQYIKDISSGISSIAVEDPLPADGWHFNGGWGDVEWAKDEAFKWWNWAYYNDDFDTGEPA